jgi:hypothetical protein
MGWIFIIIGAVFAVGSIIALLFYYEKSKLDTEARINKIQDQGYHPNMTPAAARRAASASVARTAAAKQAGEEVRAVIDMFKQQAEAKEAAYKNENVINKIKSEEELAGAERQAKIAQHITTQKAEDAKQVLIEKALERNWDMLTFIEVEKMIALNQLELDKQWQEAEQKLKAGFIYQLQAQQHLLLLTEYIGGLYEKSREYEAKGKERERLLIEEHITFMEGDFRGRQRLLQNAEQNILRGSDEDTDLR